MPGVVDTTHVFATDQVVTSTLMNNIIDETTFTSQALAAGTSTLELVSGRMKVATGGIASNELATSAVTSTKISDNAVITSKILNDAVITSKISNDAVTTAKIADGSVTLAKITIPPNFPIQIVSVTKSNTQQFTSAASVFQDITGLSLTLTRTFPDPDGKVLIQAQVNTDTDSGSHGVAIRILRDGVPIGVGNADGLRLRATSFGAHASDHGGAPIPISFLDETPGSAATVTYKLQALSAGGSIVFINRENRDLNNADTTFRAISTLTLTELAP